jgi:hypothetical protein
MKATRSPEPRIVFMSVALVGIGSMAGAFLDRLSFPHVAQLFNTCASSKQFIVEFRKDGYYWQAYPKGTGISSIVRDVKLDMDGIQVGSLGKTGLRRFLCEGKHTAHVRYPSVDGEMEMHTIDFAVSRPSLFQVYQARAGERAEADCRSGESCTSTVWMDLSPYEPDDVKVRVYPPERKLLESCADHGYACGLFFEFAYARSWGMLLPSVPYVECDLCLSVSIDAIFGGNHGGGDIALVVDGPLLEGEGGDGDHAHCPRQFCLPPDRGIAWKNANGLDDYPQH